MNPGEAGEIIATANYCLGTVNGYERAAHDLRKRAGLLFARDRDTEAKVYRRLAGEFEAKSRVLRREYDAGRAPDAVAAFAFLEGLDVPNEKA